MKYSSGDLPGLYQMLTEKPWPTPDSRSRQVRIHRSIEESDRTLKGANYRASSFEMVRSVMSKEHYTSTTDVINMSGMSSTTVYDILCVLLHDGEAERRKVGQALQWRLL